MAIHPQEVSPTNGATSNRLRVVTYRRVSTQSQVKGYSLGAQEKDCRALANQLGAVVVADYEDGGASGHDWDLPGLNAILAAAKRHEFDILIVPDPDRLARNMAKQLVVEEELRRFGVTIQYVNLPLRDTAEDRLLKNVRGSIAEYEREKIMARSVRGKREKAERGKVVGGSAAPYGYRFIRDKDGKIATVEPDPEESPIVRRMFRALLTDSLVELANALTGDGVPGPTGTHWNFASIHRIVTNPVYIGTWVYGRHHKRWRSAEDTMPGQIIIPVSPLVDQETWEAVAAAMTRRKKVRKGRKPEGDDPFALRGMFTCGHCDGVVSVRWNNGYRYYSCRRALPSRAKMDHHDICTFHDVPADELEADVWDRIASSLLDPERLTAGLAESREEHTQAERRQHERLEILQREMGRHRGDLKGILRQRITVDAGSERDQLLEDMAQESEQTIRRLQTEYDRLATMRVGGMSAEEASDLERFAAEVRDGIGSATPAEKRQVYRLLQLHGTLREDADGKKYGRFHHVACDLHAVIPVASDVVPTRTGMRT